MKIKGLSLKEDKRYIIQIILWVMMTISIALVIGLTSSFLRKDWQQTDQSGNFLSYGGVKADYGPIHVYALTMTIGMILAVGFSLYNFNRKHLMIEDLAIGVIFIIPCSLFGASFFGKLNANGLGINAANSFFGLFAFWEGGMAIHGGVYVGSLVGIIIFYFIGRKRNVSLLVYGDAIIPNILLGQAVGRWGNFFNHEVLGAEVAKISLNPISPSQPINDAFIDQIWNGYVSTHGRPLLLPDFILKNCLFINNNGDVILYSPIFFYESMSLLAAWVIITFIIPNISKLFTRPLKEDNTPYKFNIWFSIQQFFMPWLKSSDEKLSYKDAWKQAWKENTIDDAKTKYLEQINQLNLTNNTIVKRWQKNQILHKLNNPKNYSITRSGCAMFSYFMIWNLVRFILELQRPDNHLFIMYDKNLSLGIIGISAVLGFIGIILSQYILPKLTRRLGYLYEIEYFSIVDVN